MNTHVRDNLKSIGDAYVAYTPTLGGAGAALGNGSITAGFSQSDKKVAVRIFIQAGTTTAWGTSGLTLTLPVAPFANMAWHLEGHILNGGNRIRALGFAIGSTTLSVTHGATMVGLTNTAPGAIATGNQLFLHGEYEAA
jgi:hypothetical protein